MCKSATYFAVLCSVMWLQWSSAVYAQNLTGAYGTMPYTPSAVSPYLNLGYTTSGLSNYQTLVKPMLDEQTALTMQAASVAQLQQQLRRGQMGQDPNARDAYTRTRTVRFMNYSHFYGTGATAP